MCVLLEGVSFFGARSYGTGFLVFGSATASQFIPLGEGDPSLLRLPWHRDDFRLNGKPDFKVACQVGEFSAPPLLAHKSGPVEPETPTSTPSTSRRREVWRKVRSNMENVSESLLWGVPHKWYLSRWCPKYHFSLNAGPPETVACRQFREPNILGIQSNATPN